MSAAAKSQKKFAARIYASRLRVFCVCYNITMRFAVCDRPRYSAARMVRRAESLCRRRALRLTEWRRRVLEIVCRSGRPPTAYNVLHKLGDNVHPPIAYRALDFLEENGFLHKLKSRGVYTVCGHPDCAHSCYFLVCTVCGKCTEFCGRRLDMAVSAAVKARDFTMRKTFLEIEGVCAQCRK